MTTDLSSALADAHQLQSTKSATHASKTHLAAVAPGLGPDRPMPYIAALRAGDLTVDHSYQRDLDRARVRKMAEEWDPTMLGVLDVADRGPNASPRYALINGQHRHATALQADPRGEDTPLVCNVHRGLTVADEATLFHQIDATTRRLTSWDHWRARRAAGNQVVAEIEAAAAMRGLRVAPGQQNGNIGASGALEALHQLGGTQLIDVTLGVLTAAFGAEWAGYQAALITGVGLLLHYYPQLDLERVSGALTKSTPQQLRAQAVAYRELMPGQLPRLVAQVLINRINTGRGPKLPDVRDQIPLGRLRRAIQAGEA